MGLVAQAMPLAKQRKGHEALTQALGQLAYDLDVQALLAPSAASKGGSNLIVFVAKFGGSSGSRGRSSLA